MLREAIDQRLHRRGQSQQQFRVTFARARCRQAPIGEHAIDHPGVSTQSARALFGSPVSANARQACASAARFDANEPAYRSRKESKRMEDFVTEFRPRAIPDEASS